MSNAKDIALGVATGGLYTVADKLVYDPVKGAMEDAEAAAKAAQDQLAIQEEMAAESKQNTADMKVAAEEQRELEQAGLDEAIRANEVAASDREKAYALSEKAASESKAALAKQASEQAEIRAAEDKRIAHEGEIASADKLRTEHKRSARKTRARSGGGLLSGGDTGIMNTADAGSTGLKTTLGA